jgi:hypothetical protein
MTTRKRSYSLDPSAVDRRKSGAVALLKACMLSHARITIPAGVVAEWWRGATAIWWALVVICVGCGGQAITTPLLQQAAPDGSISSPEDATGAESAAPDSAADDRPAESSDALDDLEASGVDSLFVDVAPDASDVTCGCPVLEPDHGAPCPCGWIACSYPHCEVAEEHRADCKNGQWNIMIQWDSPCSDY